MPTKEELVKICPYLLNQAIKPEFDRALLLDDRAHLEKAIDWVEEYFKNVFKEIYFSNHAYFEYKGLPKSGICKQTKTEFFIEDCPDYAIDCAEKGINVLLLNKPYNKHVERKNITRVYSWNGITDYFKNI